MRLENLIKSKIFKYSKISNFSNLNIPNFQYLIFQRYLKGNHAWLNFHFPISSSKFYFFFISFYERSTKICIKLKKKMSSETFWSKKMSTIISVSFSFVVQVQNKNHEATERVERDQTKGYWVKGKKHRSS